MTVLKKVTFEQALLKAQTICSRQEKCEHDIIQKLFDWKVEKSLHSKIIKSLKDENYINEERYASSFVKDKLSFNKWGIIKIRYALLQKNIPEKVINNALNEIDEQTYEHILKEELLKKLKSLKESDEYIVKSKLLQYALSKGFENGKVFDMVSEIQKSTKK